MSTASQYALVHARFNKLIVHAYKAIGFVALTGILFGLVSFLAVHAFYYLSHRWAKPLIVSPTDKQVLELRAQLAHQESARDGLVGQRLELQARLEDQDRILVSEQAFQTEYARMLTADIEFRRKTLARLSRASWSHAQAATTIARANGDFAELARQQTKDMLDGHLITKDDAIKTAEQSASLATATLGIDEKSVELDTRVALLERDIEALEVADDTLHAATPGATPNGAMSFEVLAMKRDYDHSKLDAARAGSSRAALTKSIKMLDDAIGRADRLVESIHDSPYLRALDRHVAIAFVPYDNLAAAAPGTRIYACRASFVLCKSVGVVREVLEGEATSRHPTQSIEVRGVLVEMDLADFHAAESDVLQLGRAPLLF